MPAARLHSIAVLAAASLLASGCYCPMLSGRYCELGCRPPYPLPASAISADCRTNGDASIAARCHNVPHGFRGLGGRLGTRHLANQTVGEQGPNYVSPAAKFHPCPTRPVFEPQLAYPPLQLVEAAGDNPLRPSVMIHSR
jgi:hypothetical protein